MQVEFQHGDLDRLETDATFTAGFPREIIRAYRRRMQAIRAAVDERDLYVFASWRFKKLLGDRRHQRSIRLNNQWRLIVEIRKAAPLNVMVIIGIEDYH
jgi:proteic killer suppression protein